MTPLTKKLQMKPGATWLLYNAPAGYLASLDPLPAGLTCTLNPKRKFEGIQLFVRNKAELSSALKVIVPLLKLDTIFWVSYFGIGRPGRHSRTCRRLCIFIFRSKAIRLLELDPVDLGRAVGG